MLQFPVMQSGGIAIQGFLRRHLHAVVLTILVLALSAFPVIAIYLVLGNTWQGILPPFTDEGVYYAHIQTIGQGYVTDGNPFFFEHRDGPPLVIFGGAWLNALPLLVGLSLNATMLLNFIIWSLAFAGLLYWLFKEWTAPPWVAVFGSVFIYLQSYAHVWRAVNLQPVYPFYFLFYIALTRLIREPNRRNMLLMALATGIAFYVFAYLWQIAVITLGLLFLYAVARKNWLLMRASVMASAIGGIIGLPIPLYMLWLSNSSPYFWESIGRLGLVDTHLPMAEVVYSGGWIGVILVLLATLYSRTKEVREDRRFILLGTFIATSGLGLWIMQGSNVITGKLLETGEHVRTLILPWLAFATILVGTYLWRQRARLSKGMRIFSFVVISACSVASFYFVYLYFVPFINVEAKRETWQTTQLYAKPFAWLDQEEKEPVVVWSDPSDGVAPTLPALTNHFSLYTSAGLSTLVSESEIRERFLISQYFNNPTIEDLKSDSEMTLYLGRHDIPHYAKSIERGIKICRILFSWDRNKDCGTPPTSQELLGDQFFTDLENRFQTDIKPNIKAYLKKYHVSYILKDVILDPQYNPEKLGAVRVYSDGRFEIYHLP